jgi:UDP-glucose 4-epimerase
MASPSTRQPEDSSVNELADMVRRAMSVSDHPVRHLAPRNEVLHAFSDHSKLHRVFGVSAQVDLREGVRRMANWAREHGARETSLFAGIEIERGLPEGWAQLRSR